MALRATMGHSGPMQDDRPKPPPSMILRVTGGTEEARRALRESLEAAWGECRSRVDGDALDLAVPGRLLANGPRGAGSRPARVAGGTAAPAPARGRARTPSHPPTPQQSEIRDACAALGAGDEMAARAYAGTGKTSTLVECAAARSDRGLYVAFNKSVQMDARRRFGSNVEPSTMHSLAFRWFKDSCPGELSKGRPYGRTVAEALGLPPMSFGLPSRDLGEFVVDTWQAWLQSDDALPERRHVVLPPKVEDDPAAVAAIHDWTRSWAKLVRERSVHVTHDAYLKEWVEGLKDGSVRPPRFGFVMIDEAQDLNPVMVGGVRAMDAARVFVGDPYQAIYGWRGASDALADVRGRTLPLSTSFRFGGRIAAMANWVLSMHPNPPRDVLEGAGADDRLVPASRMESPDAVLCRSRMGLLMEALSAADEGRSLHVVGGVQDLGRVCRSVVALYNDERHRVLDREVARFRDWLDLREYVDKHGDRARELKFAFETVEDIGPVGMERRLATVEAAHVEDEDRADVSLSTVHKAKGREWDTVRVSDDLITLEDIEAAAEKKKLDSVSEEINLAYVAVTRARKTCGLPPTLVGPPPDIPGRRIGFHPAMPRPRG